MHKRLVICGDGTWNEPEQTDQGIPSPSNVVKLAVAVSPFDSKGVPQVIYYHTGIGAHGGGTRDRITSGALGTGISRNIRDLYLFLVLNYFPGDEVFLFGFSRGAYTVRSLAGLIRNSGILQDKYVEKYQEAYELYRDRTDRCYPCSPRSMDFRSQYSWPDFNIKFIGVWDTVGALGIPVPFQFGRKQWEFHDVELSSHVDYAYQALAIDEQRRPFVPCIWVKQKNSPQSQVLEQVWFPGAHCNVGGGYYDTGLSDCALDWMWHRATQCGLQLDIAQKPLPNPNGVLRSSMTIGYRVLGGYKPRVLGAMLPTSNEYLSQATIDRQSSMMNYRPKNVSEFLRNHSQKILHN